MKVLQVLPMLNSGGVERGTLEIAEALVKNNSQSWVMSGGGQLVESLQRGGSTHKQWSLGKKSPATLRQVPKVRRWLEQQDFDVVHLRSRMPAWVIWLAWRKMDKATRPRLVTTVHGLYSVNRYSEIMTCGERVIAVSHTVEDYILENYPRKNPGSIDPGKVELIYRGVDSEEFPYDYHPDSLWLHSWYKDYPQLNNVAVITLPARLTRLKGHLDFVDIIAALKSRGLNIIGLIVGDEDPKRRRYAESVYRRVQDSGLKNDIIFTGFRSDIKNIYAVSDLVLSLSNKPESFGRSVLEPLSMGIPVVGYNHGGVGEILGELFPEGAVKPMCVDAVIDAAERRLSGNGQPVKRNEKFLLDNMTTRTLELYQSLADSSRLLT
ncbi:MAG: glycosyltransferase family 4 protein [Gammaproteobacteria bacterium]|nr:glycosyltransferase family 4 protein [Gammaproteobacteria bacterium]